jgi:TonB family protein
VKLSIDVDEKGAADYTILTSTGNSEVDEYVLEALRKWKWRPALRGGKPTATSFAYTWNFQGEVHHSACTHPIGWV